MPGFKKRNLTTKLNNNIIVYDLETTSADPFTTRPIEIAAIVVDQQWNEKENGRFGPTLIKPADFKQIQPAAMAKNNIKIEDLENAPEESTVFEQFKEFCQIFQPSKSKWEAPISAGYNIKTFDNIIMHRLCLQYKHVDKDRHPLLFMPMHTYDLADYVRIWMESVSNGPEGYSLEAVREFFGLSTEGAHRSMADVQDTLTILSRLVLFQRKLVTNNLEKFRKAFANTP